MMRPNPQAPSTKAITKNGTEKREGKREEGKAHANHNGGCRSRSCSDVFVSFTPFWLTGWLGVWWRRENGGGEALSIPRKAQTPHTPPLSPLLGTLPPPALPFLHPPPPAGCCCHTATYTLDNKSLGHSHTQRQTHRHIRMDDHKQRNRGRRVPPAHPDLLILLGVGCWLSCMVVQAGGQSVHRVKSHHISPPTQSDPTPLPANARTQSPQLPHSNTRPPTHPHPTHPPTSPTPQTPTPAVAHSLVFDLPLELVELRHLVGGVAGQQQVVAGLDHPGEAHEEEGVDAEHARHGARDCLRRLLRVQDGLGGGGVNGWVGGGSLSVCLSVCLAVPTPNKLHTEHKHDARGPRFRPQSRHPIPSSIPSPGTPSPPLPPALNTRVGSTHREDEAPVGDGPPEVRRLRPRGRVHKGRQPRAQRHGGWMDGREGGREAT